MTWKEVDENLNKRSSSSKKEKLVDQSDTTKKVQINFIMASCDQGVIRNGGKRGSEFAPKAILGQYKKLALRKDDSFYKVYESVLCSHESFDQMQKAQKKVIDPLINTTPTTIHIGGGHDHIYPFASSVIEQNEKVVIINLDAHLDTRSDDLHHSGTPFRQLHKQHKDKMELIQVGIHSYANSESNYHDMPMEIFSVDQAHEQDFVKNLFKRLEGETIILSLDCDAIEAQSMYAVSAVNHKGLKYAVVEDFFKAYKEHKQKNHYIGIYEYNPLLDDYGPSCARAITNLISIF